jgi:ABC-type phosphate transport system ATPase subunit
MHRGRILEASESTAFFSNPRTAEAARFVAGELLV